MNTRPGVALAPGQRVMVTQQIPQRNEVWTTRVTGRVVRFEQRMTGSWFTHTKNSKLWLDRLILRKDDGEIVECVLDPYTHIDVMEPPPGESSSRDDQTDPPETQAGSG